MIKTTGLFVLFFVSAFGLPFPDRSEARWIKTPTLQPFHSARATEESILVAWSIGHHSLDAIERYEVRVRWPLAVEPYDYNLLPRAKPGEFYPSAKVDNRSWALAWTDFSLAYIGMGRQFNFSLPEQLVSSNGTVRVFDFQVRAVTAADEWSEWSPSVLCHTIVPASHERFTIELVGTGRNNAMHSQIVIGGQAVFNRTDLKGLALAVFDRSNFNLTKLDVYDVFSRESEADRLADDLLAQGPDKFVAVVSGYAWEWRFSSRLGSVFEFFGGYYVSQWSRVFENSIQPSPYADLQETASWDSFGHPYAFFGSYGLGTGNGIESLQLNTGHYLATGKAQRAILRIPVYYNYMLGRYFVGSEWGGKSSDYFVKSQMPKAGTLHRPISESQTVVPRFQIQLQSKYAPYIGNLHEVVEYLMEANETVVWDEYNSTNSGFKIVQVLDQIPDPLVSSDPRTGDLLQTELERLWGGVSARTNRTCPTILKNRTSLTCAEYDTDKGALLQFGIGMFPNACRGGNPVCQNEKLLNEFSLIGKSDYWVSGSISAKLGP